MYKQEAHMSMYHSVGKQRFTEPQLPITARVNF